MGKSSKVTPWLHLTAGTLWLLGAARDVWAPGFLRMNGVHRTSDLLLLKLAAGTLFLIAACSGFMRMRRNSAR